MKNFVILGLALVCLMGLGGCGSIQTGGNSFKYGSFPLGGNASGTKIIISNYTSGLMDVYWDNIKINREKDKTTYKPIRPGEIFVFENNTAWVGERVSLNVQIWDITHSRIIGYGNEIFYINVQRGVVSINWTFQEKKGGQITSLVDYGDYGGYAGFGYR